MGLLAAGAVIPPSPPSNVFGNRGTPPAPPGGTSNSLHPAWGMGTLPSLPPSAGGRKREFLPASTSFFDCW